MNKEERKNHKTMAAFVGDYMFKVVFGLKQEETKRLS